MPTLKKALEELPATLKTVREVLPKTLITGYPDFNSTTGLRLCMTLTADWHTDADPFRDRTDVLRRGLGGIALNEKSDVLVMAGDITNSAHEKEYKLLKRLLTVYNSTIEIIPQMGNHDARGTSIYPYYYEAERLFSDFCRFCGIKTKKPYYCKSVNGYYFIVLATEKLLENNMYMSKTQLLWLRRMLGTALTEGKPVFVINHQIINGKNGYPLSDTGAGVGENSDELEAALTEYADKGLKILYICGHTHKLTENALEKAGENLYYLNLPSFEYENGTGFRCEVYTDRLELSGINYIENKYLPEHRYVIGL